MLQFNICIIHAQAQPAYWPPSIAQAQISCHQTFHSLHVFKIDTQNIGTRRFILFNVFQSSGSGPWSQYNQLTMPGHGKDRDELWEILPKSFPNVSFQLAKARQLLQHPISLPCSHVRWIRFWLTYIKAERVLFAIFIDSIISSGRIPFLLHWVNIIRRFVSDAHWFNLCPRGCQS